MSQRWQRAPLRELLSRSEERIMINPEETYREITIRLWGKGVTLRREVVGAEIGAGVRFVAYKQQFILSRIDARNGAFGLVPDTLDGAVVTNDFPIFNLNNSRLLPRYLEWFSKTAGFIDLCKAASEGTTNRIRLKEDRLLAAAIPLPELEEQRRIVARIEELASKIKEARGLRHQTQSELRAFSNRLVSLVLKDISFSGHLGEILVDKPRNGWSARCDNADSGTPVLSLSAVTGFQYRPNAYKRTSETTMEGAHYWLKPGDLLITRSNTPELVGHAAIYDGSPSPCIYPDLMMRLDVDQQLADQRFVHRILMSSKVRDYIQQSAKGTSPTMKKISQEVVMNIPFPTGISLVKQRRIIAELDNLQPNIDALKRLQAETAAELDALLPSILDKAFKGEL